MDLSIVLNSFLSLIVASQGVSGSVAQAGQARSYAITEWNGDCSGSERSWWDDMCMAWRHKMGDKGWSQWWNNYELVKVSKFTDPSINAWGVDNGANGIDRGDATLLCTHGGYNAEGWYGLMHTSDHGECGANVGQMKLGTASGGKIRFWQMSSCNSIRWEHREKWFAPAEGKVHVITGFHGFMYIGWPYVGEYEDLAEDGFTSKGVGRAWVDNMHHVDHWYNIYKTICPIALGFGDTAAKSTKALKERYSSNWSDSDPNYMTTRWKSGCDPDDADALPN